MSIPEFISAYTMPLYKFPPCNIILFGILSSIALQIDVFPAPTSPSIPIVIFSIFDFVPFSGQKIHCMCIFLPYYNLHSNYMYFN